MIALAASASALGISTRQADQSINDLFVAKGKLYYSIIANSGLLSNQQNAAVLTANFGQLTAENSMKWESIEPTQGQFNFDGPDTLLNFANENGLSIRGHTLVWHPQLPSFVEQITNPDTLPSVIQNHIAKVMGRYKGQIHAWDVVNEVFNEDGSMRESVFFNVLDEDFVRIAFEAAREADPDAVLYINDFNLDRADSAKVTEGMVAHVQK